MMIESGIAYKDVVYKMSINFIMLHNISKVSMLHVIRFCFPAGSA